MDNILTVDGKVVSVNKKVLKVNANSPLAIETTYSELKALRDSGKLVAGQTYIITDYECTTTTFATASANHQFDIIVVADSENTLSEIARARQHEGATYFANSNLNTWELKYCLDNDKMRFDWADEENGKGVIYYMKDEYNNELPYDFKNIMFKGSSLYNYENQYVDFNKNPTSDEKIEPDEYYYTFSITGDGIQDCSVSLSRVPEIADNGDVIDYEFSEEYITCYGNKILPAKNIETGIQFLNKIVFLGANCHSNTFDENCYDSTFGAGCYENTFGNNCYNISFRFYCIRNIFSNNCHTNTFSWGCHLNTFGNSCYGNTFKLDCDDNVFGNCCFENTFDYTCHRNQFGNMCRYNNFGHHCVDNRFGNHCNSNQFGIECRKNDFGNNCGENVFGNYCVGNKFGNECGKFDKDDTTMTGNIFGNECSHNVFENKCHSNTFGNGCSANYFQNICRYNNFANKCAYNTLLTICNNITLGYESIYNHFNSRVQYITLGRYSQYNTFGQYCTHISIEDYSRYNVVEPGVRYFDLVSSNPTSSNRIQYYYIEQTLSGEDENNPRSIQVVRNRLYKTTVKNSKSVVETIEK